MRLKTHRLVFIDETSIGTKMVRRRGRSPCSERLRVSASFGHWESRASSQACDGHGLTAPWMVDKAMDRVTFNLYIETRSRPPCQTAPSSSSTISPNKARRRPAAFPTEAPDSSSCRLKVPISIPSRWPSPSSRRYLPAAQTRTLDALWKPSETSANSSRQPNAETSSNTQDTRMIERPKSIGREIGIGRIPLRAAL